MARALRQTGQHRQAEIVLGKVIPAAGYLASRYYKVLSYRIIAANARAEAALLLADRWPNESRYQLVEAVVEWRETIKYHDRAAAYTSSQHKGQADAAWFVATFPEFDFTDPAKKQAIDKAIAERPKLVNVLHDRAHAMYALGYKNWKEYAWGFERVVKQRGGSDAFDRFHLAIALAKTGKPDEARSWFNRGVEWMEQNKGSEDEELVKLQAEAKQATIEN